MAKPSLEMHVSARKRSLGNHDPGDATGATKLALPELERPLWGAADLPRGSIDAADYKHYIFGLLFYKRLCDVWLEEYEALMAAYGGGAEERPCAPAGTPP